MNITVMSGDLLQQEVAVIVNTWNRNFLPWWVLRPHGVSGAIKRAAGTEPFRELRTFGRLALGEAVVTKAGRLPYQAIIHVACINWWGKSSLSLIRLSTENVLKLAQQQQCDSVALPILGSGSGGIPQDLALDSMLLALQDSKFSGKLVIVAYPKH